VASKQRHGWQAPRVIRQQCVRSPDQFTLGIFAIDDTADSHDGERVRPDRCRAQYDPKLTF